MIDVNALWLQLLPVVMIEAVVVVALLGVGLALMIGVEAADVLRRWRRDRVFVGNLRTLTHLTIRIDGMRVLRFRVWLSTLLFRLAAWIVGSTVSIEEAGAADAPTGPDSGYVVPPARAA